MRCDWSLFCLLLVEKVALDFKRNHWAWQFHFDSHSKIVLSLEVSLQSGLDYFLRKKKLDWMNLQWAEFAMRRICYKWSRISKFLAKIARLENYLKLDSFKCSVVKVLISPRDKARP